MPQNKKKKNCAHVELGMKTKENDASEPLIRRTGVVVKLSLPKWFVYVYVRT